MARPVHPSHHPSDHQHGKTGHPDGKTANAPAHESEPPRAGYAKRALDRASEATENWASRRDARPNSTGGVGRAARSAFGSMTTGAKALASGGLHNQDPYAVASISSEVVGVARTAANGVVHAAGDIAASLTNHHFARKAGARAKTPGKGPAAGQAGAHDPAHGTSPGHAPQGSHPPKAPIFGDIAPADQHSTSARDALGQKAADVQRKATGGPAPGRQAGRQNGIERE